MKHVLHILAIFAFVGALLVGDVHADVTTDVTSIISITNQEYSTTNSSSSPSDNSLGIIRWQNDKYNNETVYFEAVIYCASCSGGNQDAIAELYSTAGSLVTGASVSTDQGTYQTIRSGDITANLTNNTDYTVRLRRDATSGTAYVKHARLVIVQSSTEISDSLTHVEMGTSDTSANTSYELMNDTKIYLYDQDAHSDIQNIFFEASLVNNSGGGTSYAALSSSSNCSSTVTGSEVTVIGTTWTRSRSADISANVSDDTEYWVCIKASASSTNSIARASLIIEQSNVNGIEKIETVLPFVSEVVTDNDGTYTSVLGVHSYNPASYDADAKYAYVETTMNTDAGTAYARLYNNTSTTAITNTEITTTSSSYTRVRSADIQQFLPGSTANIDLQIKNSGLNTTTVSNGWLILRIQQIPDPSMVFTVESVAADVTANGITTSVASDPDTLDFSNITLNVPKYIAHSLTTTSNATNGYTVSMKLTSFLQGDYPGNNIDPFPASWGTPQLWTQPTGTTPNSDTGWIGANTTDTRVSGWSSASQKFGPVNSSQNTIMYSSGADEAGTTATVTYVIETNMFQPADFYRGTLLYEVLPTY